MALEYDDWDLQEVGQVLAQIPELENQDLSWKSRYREAVHLAAMARRRIIEMLTPDEAEQ